MRISSRIHHRVTQFALVALGCMGLLLPRLTAATTSLTLFLGESTILRPTIPANITPDSYTWFSGNQPAWTGGLYLAGYDTPALEIQYATQWNAKNYRLRVTYAGGEWWSDLYEVNVINEVRGEWVRIETLTTAPFKTELPRQYAPGSTLEFTIPEAYRPQLTGADLQWCHDDLPIAGATGYSLVLTNVSAADSGNYRLQYTDTNGIHFSADTLTVNIHPLPDSISPYDTTFIAELPEGSDVLSLHELPSADLIVRYQNLYEEGHPVSTVKLTSSGQRVTDFSFPAEAGRVLAVGSDSTILTSLPPYRLDALAATLPLSLPAAFDPTAELDAAIVLPDGRFILAQQGLLSRHLNDGSVDPSFNFTKADQHAIAMLQLDASGRVYLDGSIDIPADSPRDGSPVWHSFLRLNDDGSVDSSFTPIESPQIDRKRPDFVPLANENWVRSPVSGQSWRLYDDTGTVLQGLGLPDQISPALVNIGSDGTAFAYLDSPNDPIPARYEFDISGSTTVSLDETWVWPAHRPVIAEFAPIFRSRYVAGSPLYIAAWGHGLLRLRTDQPAPEFPPVVTVATHTSGANLVLSATGRARGSLSYQWLSLDGPSLPADPNTEQLIVSKQQPGRYQCRVSNGVDTVLSAVTAYPHPDFVPTEGLPTVSIQADAPVTLGAPLTLTPHIIGSGPYRYEWRTLDGQSLPGDSSAPSLHFSSVGTENYGRYQLYLIGRYGWTLSNIVRVGSSEAPLLSIAPITTPTALGDTLRISASATGNPTRFQWSALDGQPLPADTTSATLVLENFSAANQGRYQIEVTWSNGVTDLRIVTVDNAAWPARIVNLSGRALVGTGQSALIAGVTLESGATTPPDVLVRGVGPGLSAFGLGSPLPNPVITLRKPGGELIGENDAWNQSPDADSIRTISTQVGAFPLSETSADAASLLQPGASQFTAALTDRNDASGTALLEVYDVPASPETHSGQITNLSLRALAGDGDATVFAGFVVEDPLHLDRSVRVLLRAVGPGLANLGVASPLADPVLTLRHATLGVIRQVDDWGDHNDVATAAAQVGAFSLTAGSTDAALITDLPPGAYTIAATGNNGATGIVLLEIYLVK